ncbi:uncharacterized protein LOC122800014 [Protopterus annectens]|uniref:uncharacterized protein LOC122800014 n=1 Tax=Protopterus annectens TaxID=7888 RepID=UPI001CFB3017|nr:uncharacterized protein LOC122800014 [Protopterus annectens]
MMSLFSTDDILSSNLKMELLGFCIAAETRQPPSIAEFAAIYFTHMLKFKAANPHLSASEVITEFHQKIVNNLPTSSPEMKSVALQTSLDEVSDELFSSKQAVVDSSLPWKTEASALVLKPSLTEPEAKLPIKLQSQAFLHTDEVPCILGTDDTLPYQMPLRSRSSISLRCRSSPNVPEMLTYSYHDTTTSRSDPVTMLERGITVDGSSKSEPSPYLQPSFESSKQAILDSPFPQKTEPSALTLNRTMVEPEEQLKIYYPAPSDILEVPHEDVPSTRDAVSGSSVVLSIAPAAVPSLAYNVQETEIEVSPMEIEVPLAECRCEQQEVRYEQHEVSPERYSAYRMKLSLKEAVLESPLHPQTEQPVLITKAPRAEPEAELPIQIQSQVLLDTSDIPSIASTSENVSCHIPVRSRYSVPHEYSSESFRPETLTFSYSDAATTRSSSVKISEICLDGSSRSVPTVATSYDHFLSVHSLDTTNPPLPPSEASSKEIVVDSQLPQKPAITQPEAEPFIKIYYQALAEASLDEAIPRDRHDLSSSSMVESGAPAAGPSFLHNIQETGVDSPESYSASGLKQAVLESLLCQITKQSARSRSSDQHEYSSAPLRPETLTDAVTFRSGSVKMSEISLDNSSMSVPSVTTSNGYLPSAHSLHAVKPSLPLSEENTKQTVLDSSFPQITEQLALRSTTAEPGAEPFIKIYYQAPSNDFEVPLTSQPAQIAEYIMPTEEPVVIVPVEDRHISSPMALEQMPQPEETAEYGMPTEEPTITFFLEASPTSPPMPLEQVLQQEHIAGYGMPREELITTVFVEDTPLSSPVALESMSQPEQTAEYGIPTEEPVIPVFVEDIPTSHPVQLEQVQQPEQIAEYVMLKEKSILKVSVEGSTPSAPVALQGQEPTNQVSVTECFSVPSKVIEQTDRNASSKESVASPQTTLLHLQIKYAEREQDPKYETSSVTEPLVSEKELTITDHKLLEMDRFVEVYHKVVIRSPKEQFQSHEVEMDLTLENVLESQVANQDHDDQHSVVLKVCNESSPDEDKDMVSGAVESVDVSKLSSGEINDVQQTSFQKTATAQKATLCVQKTTQHVKKPKKCRRKKESATPVKQNEDVDCTPFSANLVPQPCFSDGNPLSNKPQFGVAAEVTPREVTPGFMLPAVKTDVGMINISRPPLAAEVTSRAIYPDLKLPNISACQDTPTVIPVEQIPAFHSCVDVCPEETSPKTPCTSRTHSDSQRKHDGQMYNYHCVEHIGRESSSSYIPMDVPVQQMSASTGYAASVSPERTSPVTLYASRSPPSPSSEHGGRVHNCHHAEDVGRECSPSYIPVDIAVQQVPAFCDHTGVSSVKTTKNAPCTPRPPSGPPRRTHGGRMHNHHHVYRESGSSYIPIAIPVQQMSTFPSCACASPEETSPETLYTPRSPPASPRNHGNQMHTYHHIAHVGRKSSSYYIPTAVTEQQMSAFSGHDAVSPEKTTLTSYAPRPPSGPPRQHGGRVRNCHHTDRDPSPSYIPTTVPAKQVPTFPCHSGSRPPAPRPTRNNGGRIFDCHHAEGTERTSVHSYIPAAVPVQQMNIHKWAPTIAYVPLGEIMSNCIPFSPQFDCPGTGMQ